jgi:hypothetical protein
MDVSVCPAAVVRAPVSTVWALLTDPQSYGAWWDIRDARVTPAGPARPGQVVTGWAGGLGRRWPVRVAIEAVDAGRHQIRFAATLPLGLTSLNVLTCTPLDATRCRVQFG